MKYGGSPGRPGNPDTVGAPLDELADVPGTSKLAAPVLVELGRRSTKDSRGVTAFALIPENVRMHALPLRDLASADVCRCQDRESRLENFRGTFELSALEHDPIVRGTRRAFR